MVRYFTSLFRSIDLYNKSSNLPLTSCTFSAMIRRSSFRYYFYYYGPELWMVPFMTLVFFVDPYKAVKEALSHKPITFDPEKISSLQIRFRLHKAKKEAKRKGIDISDIINEKE